MSKEELNENDSKLLAYCLNAPRFISDIARTIKIDVKNVSVRIDNLTKMGLVEEVPSPGNKKYIRTIKGKKVKKFMIEALQILKERGEMTSLEFSQIFPFDFSDEFNFDKKNALSYLEFSSPSFVKKVVKISPSGLKLLQDHKK